MEPAAFAAELISRLEKLKLELESRHSLEERLQQILRRFAGYLSQEEVLGSPAPSGNLWDDIIRLEKELQDFILEAYEYQENTFQIVCLKTYNRREEETERAPE